MWLGWKRKKVGGLKGKSGRLGAGEAVENAAASPRQRDAQHAAREAGRRRLGQDHAGDVAARRPDRAEHANLPCRSRT